MDSKQLEEIKARAEAATQGPWETYKAGGNLTAQNAEFIAHAREDILALIAEVERLQAIIKQLQQEIDDNNDIGLPGLPPRDIDPELYEALGV